MAHTLTLVIAFKLTLRTLFRSGETQTKTVHYGVVKSNKNTLESETNKTTYH